MKGVTASKKVGYLCSTQFSDTYCCQPYAN